MEIAYQLNKDDIVTFRDHARRSAAAWSGQFARGALSALFIGFSATWVLTIFQEYGDSVSNPYRAIALWLLILITAGAFLVARIRTARAHSQVFVDKLLRMTFTPLRWAADLDGRAIEYTWEQVHAFEEVEHYFFLYISPQLGYVIPKHAFASADAVHAFASTLREYWARNPDNVRSTLLDRPSAKQWAQRRRADLYTNLRAGARLVRLQPVSAADFKANLSQLVRLIALSLAVGVGLQYLSALPDPQFNLFNTPIFGVDLLLYLASGVLVARAMGNTRSAAKFFVIVSSAGVVLAVPVAGALALGKLWPSILSTWILWIAGMFYLAWIVVVAFRAVMILYRPTLPVAVFATGLYVLLNFFVVLVVPDAGLFDSAEENHGESRAARLNIEDTFYSQTELMRAATDALAPQRPGVSDLFFLGFAGEADERVFANEVNYVRNLFDTRFDTAGHSLLLINSQDTVSTVPMASVHNLRTALHAIAAHMDKTNDALFLFLTSHGSRSHELSVQFWPMELNLLPANELKALLDESGIRNRIIVVSACYSGGFIDALKDDNSLIITAAARDKTSFGCGVRSKFTYFGEAYFKEALKTKVSFVEAFKLAKASIEQREKRERIEASNPQIFIGAKIGLVLDHLAH